jgi:hypothetical protein
MGNDEGVESLVSNHVFVLLIQARGKLERPQHKNITRRFEAICFVLTLGFLETYLEIAAVGLKPRGPSEVKSIRPVPATVTDPITWSTVVATQEYPQITQITQIQN